MAYIGNPVDTAFTSLLKQDLTGASGTSLTLSHAVANANDIALYINNVRQEPTEAYSVNGTIVTLTGTVAGTDDIYVIYLARAIQTTVPPDGSVSTAKIADSAVTLAKTTGLPFGKILQAVGEKLGTSNGITPNANNTWLGTGFGKSITPSSTSSKILIMCSVNLYNGNTSNYYMANIYRHSAAFTANGAVSGTQLFNDTRGFGGHYTNSGNGFENLSAFLIDEPNTTSEVFYNVCHKRSGSSSGIFDGYNMDNTLVLLEVGA